MTKEISHRLISERIRGEMTPPSPLLILGCGFVGGFLAREALAAGCRVLATTRDAKRAEQLSAMGVTVVADTPDVIDADILASCRAIVDSIPLERCGEQWVPPQLHWVDDLVAHCSNLAWVGYLSSTSVYRDAGGDWVDENSSDLAESGRGLQRLVAERAWQESAAPVELFRLSGIYGPGRNLIARLRQGGYRVVAWQPPRFSNRVHVDDIVQTLMAAMAAPKRGRVMNVSDDLPLPHAEYVRELVQMIGCDPAQQLSEGEAKQHCSPRYLAFFQDNKRISNRRLHRELLVDLRYPSFRKAMPSLIGMA